MRAESVHAVLEFTEPRPQRPGAAERDAARDSASEKLTSHGQGRFGPAGPCSGTPIASPAASERPSETTTGVLKLLSATELRKQCRLLVPFLFDEANPNPNLKPTWLAIIAGRARPDEPEVVGGVQEEGW